MDWEDFADVTNELFGLIDPRNWKEPLFSIRHEEGWDPGKEDLVWRDPPNFKVCIIGDLNAHIKGYMCGESDPGGKLIVKLARQHNLAIWNRPKTWTYGAESQGVTTIIDYILCDTDVKIDYRGGEYLNTAHKVLLGKINLGRGDPGSADPGRSDPQKRPNYRFREWNDEDKAEYSESVMESLNAAGFWTMEDPAQALQTATTVVFDELSSRVEDNGERKGGRSYAWRHYKFLLRRATSLRHTPAIPMEDKEALVLLCARLGGEWRSS